MTFRPPLIITITPPRQAAGDVWAAPNVLLTPNPSQPFTQFDWPSAALPRAKAAGEPLGTLSPLLTPNPATPFNQYEWRLTARVALSLKSDVYAWVCPLYTPNPARPFTQLDWPSAVLAKPKATGEPSGALLPLFTPAVQYQLRQPFYARLSDVKTTAKVDDFVNLLTLRPVVSVAVPFNQDLWEGAAKAWAKAAGEVAGTDAPLLTPNPSRPFTQALWENAARTAPRAIGEPLAPPSAVLRPNPAQPFVQADWFRIVNPPIPAKVDDFINLLPARGVAVVVAPFYQNDWQNAARKAARPTAFDYWPGAPYMPSPPPPPTSAAHFLPFLATPGRLKAF